MLKSDFTVQLAEAALAVDTVVVNTNQVVLTLEDTVPDAECTSDNITVSYSAGVSSLAGGDGTPVAAFSEQAVTNDTDAPPQIVSLETDSMGKFIYVTFCETISTGDNGFLTIGAFAVEVNGRSKIINDVQIQSETSSRLDIDLGRKGSFGELDDITVAYDSDDADDGDPPQDANQGNKQIESWAALAVTNRFDSPPTLNSITANYDVVTLTFSEELDENSIPAADAFAIGGVQHAPSVEDVSVSKATVTLVLSGILHNRNSPTYTLDYIEPNQKPLRQSDAALHVADIYSFSFQSSTPTAKPAVTKAEVNGAKLKITLDLPLKAVAPAGAFSIGGQAGVTISKTSFANTSLTESTVTLTLSSAVSAGATITVSYTKPDQPPRIEGRNITDADSFTNQSVTNNTVAPAPEFSSATVSADGSTATVTFTLALDASAEHTPKASSFSLTGSGASVDSVSIVGSAVVLSLDPLADVGETITLGYTPPADSMAARLQSADHAQPVAAFSNRSTTNNADGKPRPVAAEVDGDRLTISFDRPLDSSSTPAQAAVSVAGTTATVTKLSVSKSDVIVTLSSAVNHTERISVSYTAPTESPLKRTNPEIGVDSFVSLAVTNLAEDPTPTFVSASIDPTGRALTITMSHPLLTTVGGLPDKATFSLGGSAEAAVDSLAVSGSTVVLKLDPAADVDETVTISYQPPTDATLSALQSSDGMWKVAAWANQPVTNSADGVPRLVSAVANTNSIVLEFDRSLDQDSSPPTAEFSIKPVGNPVTQISINETSLTLTLTKAIAFGDIVTVAYSAAGSDKLKRDGMALDVLAFSEFRALNETPEPLVRSIIGDGGEIVISFSVTLDTNSTPDASAFSLGSGKPAVSSVIVSSMAVTLTLSASLVEGADYTLTYVAPVASPLRKSDGAQIANLSNAVSNSTDVAPSVVSTVGDGAKVTITFDQPLDSIASVLISSFSFSPNPGRTVTAVSIEDSIVSLTILSPLKEDEEASLSYTKPDSGGVRDQTGHQVESFSHSIDNQTDTAPTPVSATVQDRVIVIVLDQSIYEDPRFMPNEKKEVTDGVLLDHFTLTGTDAEVVAVRVANDGPGGVGKIVITLSKDVEEEDSISIHYFPSSGTIRIRDDDAGSKRAVINSYGLVNQTKSPPEFVSATLDGALLAVSFNRALDTTIEPMAAWFALTPNTLTIESATIDGSTLQLGVAPSAMEDDEYNLTYTAPATGGLAGDSGLEVKGLSQAVEVDNVTDYAPYPVAIVTDRLGTTISVTFDQRIQPPSVTDSSWFSLGDALKIYSAEIGSYSAGAPQLVIVLEDSTPVREGTAVSLTYTPPANGGLRDDDAGNPVGLLEELPVTNNVDVAPLVTGATVNGFVLTIDFDQALHDDPEDVPPASCEELKREDSDVECLKPGDFTWFTVQRNNTDIVPIDSVKIAGKAVVLSLQEPASESDSITFRYQPKSYDNDSRNLRDTSDPANYVTSFGPVTATNIIAAAATSVSFDREAPKTIVIKFDGPLQLVASLTTEGLRVSVDDAGVAVAEALSSGSEITVALVESVPECSSLELSYSPSGEAWLDAEGRQIEAFSFHVPNLIESTWGLRCVESDFGNIVLTFAADSDVWPFDETGWRLSVDDEERHIDATQSGDAVVTLIPTPPICIGDTTHVGYSDDSLLSNWVISTAAPCALSARTEDETLLVTLDASLDDEALPHPSEFTLSESARVVAATEIEDDVLKLRLSAPGVHITAKPMLRYDGSTLTSAGRTVGPFELAVTVVAHPPELKSAFGFGSFVSLEFDKQLSAREVSPSRFIPSVPRSDDLKVRSVNVSGTSVALELSEDLPDDFDLFALIYLAKTRGGLESLVGARVDDSVFVVENLTETAPTVESAVARNQQITVTFNQRVEATEDQTSNFKVRAGRRDIAATSLAWSNNSVVIELPERITSLDAVQLHYAPDTAGSVRDSSGIALKPFKLWADNRTPRPRSIQRRVDDAKLRSSNGETTFARELARGFAASEGINVVVTGERGLSRIVRGGLRLLIDAEPLGDETIRVHAHRVEHTADVLEQIASVPASCLHGADEPDAKVWWVGSTDLEGVPTDLETRIVLSGEEIGGLWTSHCVLDLISGQWQIMRPGDPIVGPSLIVQRDLRLRPTAELWPLVG